MSPNLVLITAFICSAFADALSAASTRPALTIRLIPTTNPIITPNIVTLLTLIGLTHRASYHVTTAFASVPLWPPLAPLLSLFCRIHVPPIHDLSSPRPQNVYCDRVPIPSRQHIPATRHTASGTIPEIAS